MLRNLAVSLLLLSTSAASAQPQNEAISTVVRDVTIAEISKEFGELNMQFRTEWQMAMTEDAATAVVEAAIKRVLALRDRLADNPYIRVASFSVGLPAGISVEFSLPEQAD